MLTTTSKGPTNVSTSYAGNSQPVSTAQKYTPAELFDRSLKKDATQFSDLRDIVDWESWSRMFETQIKLHDCANVIDESYSPSAVED